LGLGQMLALVAFMAAGLLFFGVRSCSTGSGAKEITPPVLRTANEMPETAVQAQKLSQTALEKFSRDEPLTEDDLKNLREAGALLQGIINYEPGVVHPYVGAGLIYRALGAGDKAETLFTRAVNNGRILADEQSKLSVAEAHYNLALIQIERRNYSQAVEEANQAIEAVPNSPNYLSARASAYIQLKKKREAMRDIRTALQLDPNHKRSLGLKKLLTAALLR
jgi:tetratricopeptide (TPR) repeat protein